MTKLKSVKGDNIFCGPAVLSSLTGKTTDECAQILAEIKRIRVDQLSGVTTSEMLLALKKLRFDTEEVNTVGSLFWVINYLIALNRAGSYYISLPTHAVVVEVDENRQAYFNDNHTKEPIKAEMSARLMQKVSSVIRVTPKEELKLIEKRLVLDRFNSTSGMVKVQVFVEEIFNDEEANTKTSRGYLYVEPEFLSELSIKLQEIMK